MEECGDGEDSNVDGELCELLDEAARETHKFHKFPINYCYITIL